jgi:hypothetical protein
LVVEKQTATSDLQQIKALKASYNKTFNSEEGEKVLADLKRTCFYDQTTINTDPHITAFCEGQRAVVLHILTKMKMDTVKLEGEQNGEGQP